MSSGDNSNFMRKSRSTATDSASREKILTIKNFQYVVKNSERKEFSGNRDFSSEYIKNSFNDSSLNQMQLEKDSERKEFSENRDFSSEYFKNSFNDSSLNQMQLEKDHLSKVLAKQLPGVYILSLEDVLHNEISNEYLEYMYITSVYIMNNYCGLRCSTSEEPQTACAFINQLIPLSSKIKYYWFKKTRKIQSPDFILNIKVIEAADLTPTDPDGLSDPFCKIWMNNDKEHAKITSIKEHTLYPVWNESFNFCIRDLSSDILHIEVWDKDPRGFTANVKLLKNVKSLGGFCLFCNDCCQDTCYCCAKEVDDFIGKVDISVKEIYSEGIDDWTTLKGTKKDNLVGRLHVSLNFEVLRPRNILDALKRHFLLFKMCLQESLKEYNSHFNISRWDQILSPAAFTLLLQHSKQSSLTVCEDILCRFIVFVYLLQNQHSFNYKFLYCIIDETYQCTQQSLSADCPLESSLEDLYRESVDKVYHICVSIIAALHSIDLTGDEGKCMEFEFVLKCICVCQDILGNEGLLWKALKSEAAIWFEQVATEMRNKDSEIRTDFITKTLANIISYHSAADKVMKKVFPSRSYTFFTYEILDSALSESLKLHIAEIGKESVTSVDGINDRKLKDALKVFVKMKELDEYICKTLDVSQSGLQTENFREWFGSNTVENWFKWKEELICRQIRQIVYKDSLKNMLIDCAGRLEKQSSSSKSTSNLIQKELVQLWNLVSHPKYLQYDSLFLKVLHSSCMKYAEFSLSLIHSKHVIPNFRMSGLSKLCVMANNLWSLGIFVQNAISVTVINLPPDYFDTKFCLQLICRIICADISKELELDIVNLIKKVVDAKNTKKQIQAITSYRKYVQHLFTEEAMPYMAFEIYVLFQKETMEIILNIVRFFKELHKDSESMKIMKIYRQFFVRTSSVSGLLSILTETEKLCFVDDCGKIKQCIWTDAFEVLQNELQQLVVTAS